MTVTSKTLSADSLTSSTDALDFGVADETWTIKANIIAASTQADGVVSNFANSTLINNGQVFGNASIGAFFEGGGKTSVTNASGASIIGSFDGLVVNGVPAPGLVSALAVASGPANVVNHGIIDGYLEFGVASSDANVAPKVTNTGVIDGDLAGIYLNGGSVGGTVDNSGVIRSQQDGIEIANVSGSPATVVKNAAGALIQGDSDAAIRVQSGGLNLTNQGTIKGAVTDAGGTKDVITNAGKITGIVSLSAGNDTFNGKTGTSGAIYGNGGSDHLAGGSGADQIHGGAGKDTLTGWGGADKFYFDTALNATTNVDTITDFTPGSDKIELSQADFAGIGAVGTLGTTHFDQGAAAMRTSDRIIYDPATGNLSYDRDGSNTAHAPVVFAILDAGLTLHNTDFAVIA